MEPTPIEILMIEDNDGDVFLTRKALQSAKVANNLTVITDGLDAMDYLHRKGEYASAARPDLILLDLNLPGKDGRQVLEEIRSDSALELIPVVVLTGSKAEQDIVKAYELHANCYVVKPVDFEKLLEVVNAIETFWLTVVKLPPNDR